METRFDPVRDVKLAVTNCAHGNELPLMVEVVVGIVQPEGTIEAPFERF